MINNTSIDKFSVFLPFDVIEKSGEDGVKEMKIKGIASTAQKDTDEEILEPDGFDLSKFLKSGFFNYNHLASKDPSMIIGEPTKAFSKNGQLHLEGILYPESEMAVKVYDTAKILKKGSKTRSFGFSIEGKALERDPLNPKRITKASITGCAITPSPKNPGTNLEIVKGGIEAFQYEPEDGSEFLIDVTDENGVRTTVDKNFVIEKSDTNELEKGGEGSKGGKVIGHTRTGKPIYDHFDHKGHKDFTNEDHADAYSAHSEKYQEAVRNNKGKHLLGGEKDPAIDHHRDHGDKHLFATEDVKKGDSVQEASTAEEMDKVTTKESVEGGKKKLDDLIKKKRKIDQDKKTFSKSETYEEIFSMFNCNVEDAPHLYKLIEGIQYALTPGMEKVQISKEAIQKAQEILGLATKVESQEAPKPDAEAIKKAEDQKKLQVQLDETLKKAEEIKAQLSGVVIEKPAEVIVKAEPVIQTATVTNDISKSFDEKFNALGTLISQKDNQIEELQKGINQALEFNKMLSQKLNIVASQPLDRKSVGTSSYIEKGEGNANAGGSVPMKNLSLSNLGERAQLADILFEAISKDPATQDKDLIKAVQTVELGSLGETPEMSRRLAARIQKEFKINVIK